MSAPVVTQSWSAVVALPGGPVSLGAGDILAVEHASSGLRLDVGRVARLLRTGEVRLRVRSQTTLAIAIAPGHGDPIPVQVTRWLDAVATHTFAGILRSVEHADAGMLLNVSLDWPWPEHQPLCRTIAIADDEVATLPVVFGRAVDLVAVALFREATVRLSRAVGFLDSEVFLAQAPDWPNAGRVQIADEVLAYGVYHRDPPRLGLLERPQRRAHATSARVALLPSNDLRWVVCDHEGDVVSLRSHSVDGAPFDDATIDMQDVDGHAALVATSDRLPVRVEHDALAVPVALGPSLGDWEIRTTTTALAPGWAFLTEAPGAGARFSIDRARLLADWTRDIRRETLRHGAPQRLVLAFEVSVNAWWRAGTRLIVRVHRGMQSREVAFASLDELAGLVPIELVVPDVDAEGRRTLLPLSLQAPAPLPPTLVQIDCTSLLQDFGGWPLFVGDDGRLLLDIELEDPDPNLVLSIRRILWHLEVLPARGVTTSTRLVADVRGLCTGDDDACAPDEVLQTLLHDERFGGLPPDLILDSDWNQLAVVQHYQSRRFRRVLNDTTTLGEALATALAESAAVIAPHADGWHVAALDALAARVPVSTRLAPADVLAPPQSLVVHAPPVVATSPEWQWLVAGAPSLRRVLTRWQSHWRSRQRVRLTSSVEPPPPGTTLLLDVIPPSATSHPALVESVGIEGGFAALDVMLLGTGSVCLALPPYRFWHEETTGELWILHGDDVIASLSPEAMRLRGTLREALELMPGGAPATLDGDPPALVLTIGLAVLRLDSFGNASLSGFLREHRALSTEPIAHCLHPHDDTLALGISDEPPMALLDGASGDLLLAGQLVETAWPPLD